MREQIVVVKASFPSEDSAREIGRYLVQNQLAACVQVLPGIRSIYCWEGKLEENLEVLLIAKTQAFLVEKLQQELLNKHPYQVPELIWWPMAGGNPSYLQWVKEMTGG